MTTPRGKRRAYVLLAIATGGISGVERWYLDGKPVAVDGDGYVTTPPWDGGPGAPRGVAVRGGRRLARAARGLP